MNRLPLEFYDSVCNGLRTADLAKLSRGLSIPFRRAAAVALRRIQKTTVAVGICPKSGRVTYSFRSRTSRIINWRIVRLTIADVRQQRNLPGGLEGDFFKQILENASIQCVCLYIDKVDLNKLDFALFDPRSLHSITIHRSPSLKPDSRIENWFRRTREFKKLEHLSITLVPMTAAVDFSQLMADFLVETPVERIETFSTNSNFLCFDCVMMTRCVERWMRHDHQKRRSVEVKVGQLDLDWRALVHVFPSNSFPSSRMMCAGARNDVFVWTTRDYNKFLFESKRGSSAVLEWLNDDDSD